MKPNEFPPHPFGWTCVQCRCWLDQKTEVYMTPHGAIPATPEAVRAGAVKIGSPKYRMGLCQLNPQWGAALSHSYCWQFLPRSFMRPGEVNEIENNLGLTSVELLKPHKEGCECPICKEVTNEGK